MSKFVSSVMVALVCAQTASAQYGNGYGHYAPAVPHGAYAAPHKQVLYPAAAYEEPIYVSLYSMT